MMMWSPSPLLILIAILAGTQLFSTWRQRHTPQAQAYRVASLETRIGYAACYLALVGFLAVMTYDVHQMLELARAGHATAGTMPAGR